MTARIFLWPLVSALAGFLFGFDKGRTLEEIPHDLRIS
jgi:hypothetical protein